MNRTIAPASSLAITLSIMAAIVATFGGCSLLAGQGRDQVGRGPWPITMISMFLIAAGAIFFCYRIGLKRGPAFGIVDGKLEHYDWKAAIPIERITGVRLEPGNFLLKRVTRLSVVLKGGKTREITTFLLRGGTERIGRSLCDALGLELEVRR